MEIHGWGERWHRVSWCERRGSGGGRWLAKGNNPNGEAKKNSFSLQWKNSIFTPLDVALASTLHPIPYICCLHPWPLFLAGESQKFCSQRWLLHLCNWLVTSFHTGWAIFFFSFPFFLSFSLQTWCWSVGGGCFARGCSICLTLWGLDSVFIRKTLHKPTGSRDLICLVLFPFPSFCRPPSFKGKPSPRSWVCRCFYILQFPHMQWRGCQLWHS